MVKKLFFVMSVMVFTVFISSACWAALIYDTGPGSDSSYGWSLNSGQWLGKRVNFSQDYNIDKIEGWMNVYSNGAGEYRTTIYTDSDLDLLPDTLLYSYTETLTSLQPAAWRSFDVDFQLSKDTDYWVFFETDSASGGAMPGSATPPDSLQYYGRQPGIGFYVAENYDFGLRLYSEAGVVPEPSSLSLLGLGLFGLMKRRRK